MNKNRKQEEAVILLLARWLSARKKDKWIWNHEDLKLSWDKSGTARIIIH